MAASTAVEAVEAVEAVAASEEKCSQHNAVGVNLKNERYASRERGPIIFTKSLVRLFL